MANEKLIERVRSGINYRSMPMMHVREKEESTEGNDGMIVEGHATTYDQPYTLYDDGDYRILEQVDRHAFDEADMEDVIFQYNHEGRVMARTRNNTLSLESDETGLFVRADLGGTELGQQVFEEINGGYTDRMSFGFTISEEKWEETYDRENGVYTGLRTITKVGRLYDVSAVSIPANDGTDISARSFCDGVIAKVKAEAEKRAALEAKKMEIRKLLEKYGE